jgi:TrmH family RNA methyltransferase
MSSETVWPGELILWFWGKRDFDGHSVMRWKRYDRDSPYSYSIGVFPTLELLAQQSEQVHEVVLSSLSHRNQGVARIEEHCRQRRIPCHIDDQLMERLSTAENTYAIGIFQKYWPPWDSSENQVVLVEPSDMGNLGTIIRTMVGLGPPRLALIRPAVDLFHPKTIRASMGALFRLSFRYFDSYSIWQKQFPGTVYAFFTDGVSDLEEITIQSSHAFVFGNEGAGLPVDISQGANTVKIAFQSTIDSLSLPVAVGIALHKARHR